MNRTEIKLEDVAKLYRNEDGTLYAEMKQKSLKYDDIVEAKKDKNIYWASGDGSIDETKGNNKNYHIDHDSESSARKTMLFGKIQRIADYANGDWVADWRNENQYKISLHLRFNSVETIGFECNHGIPVFKTEELAKQAYEDNKEIFDEFFRL